MRPPYEALLLDLDGTIICADGKIRPRTLAAIRRAARGGARVMVATGRSDVSAEPILDELGLDSEAIVFNGAAVYSPAERRLIRQILLADTLRDSILDHALVRDYLPVVMFAGKKFALAPRSDFERLALHDMTNLRIVPEPLLRAPNAIRVTLFSARHATSAEFAAEVTQHVGGPVFVTHFPLQLLAQHRDSPLQVMDVHPPCAGKAEAFRLLDERYGIPAARVVAVGDAANDIEMLERAGLAVCMAEASDDVRRVSDRVIGSCESDAVAELIEEVFPQAG